MQPVKQQQVIGTLLKSAYCFGDGLLLDLYGVMPDEDDGYTVETACVHGDPSKASLHDLLTNRQLQLMGLWLDEHQPSYREMLAEAMACRADHDRDMRRDEAATSGPWRYAGRP